MSKILIKLLFLLFLNLFHQKYGIYGVLDLDLENVEWIRPGQEFVIRNPQLPANIPNGGGFERGESIRRSSSLRRERRRLEALGNLPAYSSSPAALAEGTSVPYYEVYHNRYHMGKTFKKWNRIFGRVLPIYHSGVEIRTPQRSAETKEYGIEIDADDTPFIHTLSHEEAFTQRGPYIPYKSRLMGRTRLNPTEIDEYIEMLNHKFGGNNYQMFGNNCNNCAKAIMTHTLSPQNGYGLPERKWKSKYNRISNLLRRLPRFVKNRLGAR